jgi:hypothetical protein
MSQLLVSVTTTKIWRFQPHFRLDVEFVSINLLNFFEHKKKISEETFEINKMNLQSSQQVRISEHFAKQISHSEKIIQHF